MDAGEIESGLVDAGLSEYEAEAYLTLLDRGTAPAVDVAKHSSIPVTRIYDILNDLEAAGYVETLEMDTLHARACDPTDVVDDLHERSQRIADVATEIEDRWEQSPLGEHEMNVTKRAETVIDHAEDRIREASSVVDLAVTDEQLLAFEVAIEHAVENDVVVRASIYETGNLETPITERPISERITEVRERTIPGPFLVVVDRTVACFAPTTRLPDPYGVLINDEIVSFVFQWYFQTCLWSVWETVARDTERAPTYVCLEALLFDIVPFLSEGARVAVRVDGIDTSMGTERRISGDIANVLYSGQSVTDPDPTMMQLSGQAALVVRTDDGPYSVGGWGAQMEDLEARRIVVEDVRLPPCA